MSEENRKSEVEESLEHPEALTADVVDKDSEPEFYEVRVNKATNELIIKDPKSGQTFTLQARLDEKAESQEDDELPKPLTPDDFRTALERVDKLGLTWTADRVPELIPKELVSDEVFLSDEFEKIQQDYPALPLELSSIIFYILTGREPSAMIAGSQDDIAKKVRILDEFLITPAYKAEFFFKHAIKVPYLTDIDWEVVFKLAEKNVQNPPGVPYALLSLNFLDPSSSKVRQQERTLTVAVDEKLAKELMGTFSEIRDGLQRARGVTEAMMRVQTSAKEESNADITDKNKALE